MKMVQNEGKLVCDLTQSWSEYGGGISTYLRQKRNYIQEHSDYRHLLIVPGEKDRIQENNQLILAEVAGPAVPQSPHYRFLLRNKAVKELLAQYQPYIIESLDPYNLPWAALSHRKKYPDSALVAGYRTDFPNAHIGRVTGNILGRKIGNISRHLAYCYAARLYRRFDAVYTLNLSMQNKLTSLGVEQIDLLPLGVDLNVFHPGRRDMSIRQQMGVAPHEPLLVYAGRIDEEKRARTVLDAFQLLPKEMNAHLLLLGIGKSLSSLRHQAKGQNVYFHGYESDRGRLASMLASADIYVSGMPDETFGISVIEAQAAGLPIVGVNSGAMPDRVPAGTGLLGPVDDALAMATNIEKIWRDGAAEIGKTGRELVENSFSWQRSFEKLFQEIYPRAMDTRKSNGHQVQIDKQFAHETI